MDRNTTGLPADGRKGTYALLLRLKTDETVRVGMLGVFRFSPGYYLYVGSAFGSGGLAARIKRHLVSDKPLRWHIDYFRKQCNVLSAWISYDAARREHDWASIIQGMDGARICAAGFGSSDCSCAAHLFRFHNKPKFEIFRRLICKRFPEDDPVNIQL